ncbi:hypothetical protein Trydic_g21250 [Trypoxylus dichotomus]
MLYKTQHEVDKNREPDILTHEKGVSNQGSEVIPDITIEEIELGMAKTKNNKSPGESNVVSGVIKVDGQRLIEKLRGLFNFCPFNNTIPNKRHNSILVLLHKKNFSQEL